MDFASLLLISKSTDDIPEGQQALVDVDPLLHVDPLRLRPFYPLTSCQIHEVEFTSASL
jgi:hypothetical protein